MRDKVEHLREEVNLVSRHCEGIGTGFLIPRRLESISLEGKLASLGGQTKCRSR